MYGSDPKLKGQVEWHSLPTQVAYKMTTQQATLYQVQPLSSRTELQSHDEIKTRSENEIAVLEATTCVKLYRPFTDVFWNARTFIIPPVCS